MPLQLHKDSSRKACEFLMCHAHKSAQVYLISTVFFHVLQKRYPAENCKVESPPEYGKIEYCDAKQE